MKFKSLFVCIAVVLSMVFACCSVYAANETMKNGVLSYSVDKDNGRVIITRCDSDAQGEIVIPSEIDGYKVTKIAPNAFYYPNASFNVTKIVIPDTVNEIGANAFRECELLSEIVIPEGVKVLNGDTFESCTNLMSVKLPASLVEIGNGCFQNCGSLEEIVLPDKLEKLGVSAFYKCTKLKEINIPEKITEIQRTTFGDCKALTEIVLPKGVKCIGVRAFEGTDKLESINLDSVEEIGEKAFNAIRNRSKLKRVVLPDTLKKIGAYAFSQCTSIEYIELSNSFDHIYANTFKNVPLNAEVVFRGTQEEWETVKETKVEYTGNETLFKNVTFKEPITSTPKKEPASSKGSVEVIRFDGNNYVYGTMDYKENTATNNVTEKNKQYTYQVLDEDSFTISSGRELTDLDKAKVTFVYLKTTICLNDCKTEYAEIGFHLRDYGRIDSNAKRMVVAPSVNGVLDATMVPGYDVKVNGDETPWLCMADKNGHILQSFLVLK